MFVVIACLHLLVSVALIGVIMLQRRKQAALPASLAVGRRQICPPVNGSACLD